ncbi:glycerate kinase [Hanamia caeni]|uniref:Glycerate kinase n=1 Tax=Hanamia caeni TaxID=2294116 RepID=A0A3M9NAA8_9BACT|nr:glycerate kinase [Hanamia caeni]RNI34247.1 glycerate kinase [Hanamia caeni]
MHIVIAPNAFKGSLSAGQVAQHIAAGLKKSKLTCSLKLIPIADGGDGTAHLISKKLSAKSIKIFVHDPLGKKILSAFAWENKSKTAIIELADASGIRLLKKENLNPLKANTRGTGELIKAALDKGAKKIIIGVGGSATVDGASGLLDELGVHFLDNSGKKITEFPKGLLALNRVDTKEIDARLKECEIIVLCDVTNKLLGKNGAAAVFGPQKGADKKAVSLLEKCLHQMNKIVQKDVQSTMDAYTHGGSAGGVAAGLAAFAHAKLVSGISYFLDVVQFERDLKNADLVITAEGKVDSQTLEGKGPFGVAQKALQHAIPVVILAGAVPVNFNKELHQFFDAIFPISNEPARLDEAISNTASNLERTAFEIGNLLALNIFKRKNK